MMHLFLIALLLATPVVSPNVFTGLSSVDFEVAYESGNDELRAAVAKCRAGNFTEAIPVFEEFAEAGDVGAAYILARIYTDGHGIAPDLDKAAALLTSNVDAEHAPSMTALGDLTEDESPAEALQLYRQAAALDEPIAHLKLGDIYERGLLEVKANPKLAFFHFNKLVDADLPTATFRLARCYDVGIGVSPDALLATKLYREAALAGNVPSQVTMARRYFEGKGLEPDAVAAVGWLTRASQSGSAEARVLLGLRYENGDAVLQDFNMAGQLYSAAARHGDPTARFHLARLYAEGLGTEADPVRAYVLLSGAQVLPAAEEALAELEELLTPEQLALANRKLAEEQSKQDSAGGARDVTAPEASQR